MNKKNAFTLIEITLTITIISILSTIAFLAFSNYTQGARDTSRIKNIQQIETVLELFNLHTGKFPDPTSPIDITHSGTVVWTQGFFGEDTRKVTGKIFGNIQDPLYNNYYDYSVSHSKKEYQLGYILESQNRDYFSKIKNLSFVEDSYASTVFTPAELNPKIWLDATDIDADGVINNIIDNSIITNWKNKGYIQHAGDPIVQGNIRYTNNGFDSQSGIGKPGIFISSHLDNGIIFQNSDIKKGHIFYVVHNNNPFGNTDISGVGLQSTISNQNYIGYYGDFRNSLQIGSYPNHPTSNPANKVGRTLPSIFGFSTDEMNYKYSDTGWMLSNGATNSIEGHTWAINKGGLNNDYADFIISEILIFDTLLSESDVLKVEGYLAHKWGRNLYLPNYHPYRYSIPVKESEGKFEVQKKRENVQVTGNYNGLFAHSVSPINKTHYIFVTPSILTTDLSDPNFLKITSEKKLVYSGYGNYPAGYVNAHPKFTNTGGFDEVRLYGPVVFEGTKEKLASYVGLKSVDNAVRASYQNTSIYPKISKYLDSYGTSYLENILGNVIGINPIKPYYCSDIIDKKFTHNIAPEAQVNATQASIYNTFGTGGIVNGIISYEGLLDYEYHSDTPNGFIEFEWKEPQQVGFIRIYNRTGCCTSRLSGAHISLYDASNILLYKHKLWDTSDDYIIDLDLEGIGELHNVKKVIIESEGNDSYINIREIEIYVGGDIQDGFYLVDSDGPGGRRPYDVYCDMTTDGGGWTRILDNHIERGDFSGGYHSPNYDQLWNRENSIEQINTPIDSGYAVHQRLSIDTSINAQNNTEYEIRLTNIDLLEPGQEIRISAWVADAWDQGMSINGGKGYIFHNRLTYKDGTTSVNGTLQTLEQKVINGKLWKKQRVRIPITKEVQDFRWYVGFGAETGITRDFYFTDLRAEVYYK